MEQQTVNMMSQAAIRFAEGTGGANKPAAYVKTTTAKIVVRFTVLPTDVTSLKIKATSGGCLGGLNETEVQVINGASQGSVSIDNAQYATFSAAQSTPDTISQNTFSWEWQATAVHGNNLAQAATFGTSGSHSIYVLHAAPAAPWSTAANNTLNPWVEVLDYVCDWTSGINQPASAVARITTKAYSDFGREYHGYETHTSIYGQCDRESLLTANWADCKDMAAVVQLFANAVGFGNIRVRRIHGPFDYKPILPIGLPSWITGTWSHHMIAYYNGTVYDACEKVRQSAPYIFIADNPAGNYKNNLYNSGTFAPQSPVNATITQ